MSNLTAPSFVGAQQTISVWAPNAERIVHLIADGVRIPMKAGENGWWHSPEPLRAGTEYLLSVDSDDPRPDPRSLLQPDGPHDVSVVVDLGAHEWKHDDFTGRGLEGGAIYEMHVGTFTPDGTFDAAIEKLDYLKNLGISHVEVMPVNGVPGQRNWGYDGVNLYATQANYGGPQAFQRFVDACHAHSLAVVLDVVYNHLGPSGNYLPIFGPYFNPAHNTPWGPAVNLDGPGSDEVRRFLIENALMWFELFHIDGFRLDAVHALADDSAVPFLEELSTTLHARAADLGRTCVIIAESDRNDPATVTPVRAGSSRNGLNAADGGFGGSGMDAQWADDIHHALHVLLTGETQGYYADFADRDALRKTLNTPFFHDGTYSSFRGRRHGRPVEADREAWRFVASLQTHDQVGNRASGDRLSHLVTRDRLACAAALLLTSPYTPMLFMGEEWGARTPWQFFTDHDDPAIAEATSKGRAAEFASHGWGGVVPDPQDEQTFLNSQLDWSELDDPDGEGALLLEWYRTLLKLRARHSDLRAPQLYSTHVQRSDDDQIVITRGQYRVAVNLSMQPMRVEGDVVASWYTAQVRDGGVTLPSNAVAVVR